MQNIWLSYQKGLVPKKKKKKKKQLGVRGTNVGASFTNDQ
jgi:hypothetical protein